MSPGLALCELGVWGGVLLPCHLMFLFFVCLFVFCAEACRLIIVAGYVASMETSLDNVYFSEIVTGHG